MAGGRAVPTIKVRGKVEGGEEEIIQINSDPATVAMYKEKGFEPVVATPPPPSGGGGQEEEPQEGGLWEYTVARLREFAAGKSIAGYQSMNKKQLVEALEAVEFVPPPEE